MEGLSHPYWAALEAAAWPSVPLGAIVVGGVVLEEAANGGKALVVGILIMSFKPPIAMKWNLRIALPWASKPHSVFRGLPLELAVV